MSWRLGDADKARPAGIVAGRVTAVLPAIAAMVFGLVLAAAFGQSPARANAADATAGGPLYDQHCSACHQAGGAGIDGTFPPLAGNPAAADPAYIEAVILDGISGPIDVAGVSYDAVMPPVVALTDQAEIDAVVAYVVALAAPADEAAEPQPSEPSPADEAAAGPVDGDIERGRRLFIGATTFENGGGACAACHTAGSVGNLGGQSLGPDLTNSFETLGAEAGLTGWLANPPSPTMQPLFADNPLSAAELADLVAFLGDAPAQDKSDPGVDQLTVAGLAGLALLVVGMAVAWGGGRTTYVERLQNKSGGRGGRNRRGQQTGGGIGARGTQLARRGRQSAGAGRSNQ